MKEMGGIIFVLGVLLAMLLPVLARVTEKWA